jgi:hypothetical protein
MAIIVLYQPFVRAQQVSAEEQKIVSYVDANIEKAIALLKKNGQHRKPDRRCQRREKHRAGFQERV